ncbi:hypothetical protein ACIBOV_22700 [Micromonospora chersina]|uniref:hypothetical protein n=1 Tax=Micromonospora chersina TaxID=47854 RepID=UPI0037B00E9A
MIEVQKLAERIEAELASGRVDDADVSDQQAGKIAEVLRPSPPVELSMMARRAVRSVRRTAAYVAAGPLVPVLASAGVVAAVA